MEIGAQKDFSDVLSKAKLALQSQRFESAEKLLRQTLADHGSFAHLHNMLGVALYCQSRFAEAVKCFAEAFSSNKTYVEAGLNLMLCLCDLGRYDDADKIFEVILKIKYPIKNQPSLVLGRIANFHVQNGKAYVQAGLWQESISEFRKALALYEHMPDVKLMLAQSYIKVEEWDKAQRVLEDLLAAEPLLHDAQIWLGIVYYRMGRLADTKSCWMSGVDDLGGYHSLEQKVLAHIAKSWTQLPQKAQG